MSFPEGWFVQTLPLLRPIPIKTHQEASSILRLKWRLGWLPST